MTPHVVRPSRPVRVAIIGAGMSGILASIRLAEAGYDDVVIFEKADRVGGTWRENTYPGIACDVPSHLYSYSFAPNAEWSHTFSPGDEILAYFERVARDHGVVDRVRFGTEVCRAEFVDGRWVLETGAGRIETFDVVIGATGVLHHPKLPEIAGMDTFGGAAFHSARWDHSVPLDGARIGVIGTGSTAVQITTALARRAGHYSLFQRTAQWVLPQSNPEYSDEQRDEFRAHPERLMEIHDNLAVAFGGFASAVIDADSAGMAIIEQMCLQNLESVRDPQLRERLRPNYRAACKRLVVAPDFYEAMQEPGVELVTEAIERIEPGGIRTADDTLHELDVLVFATGFRADAFVRPMEVTGSGGRTLAAEWTPRPNAYLSITVPGFPNFFLLNGPNGPVGNFSLIEVAELQFRYIQQLIDGIGRGEYRAVAPTVEAMETHEAARVEAAQHSIWVTGCQSWYLDDRGIPATWPWTFDRFREVMAAPDPSAFEYR